MFTGVCWRIEEKMSTKGGDDDEITRLQGSGKNTPMHKV